MMVLFDKCVDKILDAEGYISKNQQDLGNKGGNITIWGISSRYHPEVKEWLNLPPEESRERAKAIYYADYWVKTAGRIFLYKKSEHIAYILFDTAVQFDPKDASKMLQRAINEVLKGTDTERLKVDGYIGSITLSALDVIDIASKNCELCWAFKAIRLYEHLQTISKHPKQAAMAGGWAKRTMGL